MAPRFVSRNRTCRTSSSLDQLHHPLFLSGHNPDEVDAARRHPTAVLPTVPGHLVTASGPILREQSADAAACQVEQLNGDASGGGKLEPDHGVLSGGVRAR